MARPRSPYGHDGRMTVITGVTAHDVRFPLTRGLGTDAKHTNPTYSYGVTVLETGGTERGVGSAFTLGAGTRELCLLIDTLGQRLVGRDVEELMAGFGSEFRALADDPQFRWLGPHKGVIHLAVSSITNACFDLWAKSRTVPLWQLLLELSPSELVATLDLSYVGDVVDEATAVDLLATRADGRAGRSDVLETGFTGYDTSVGWLALDDQTLSQELHRAIDQGFEAVKLKVGSDEPGRDLRRATLVRETIGPDATIMIDANQAWGVDEAIDRIAELDAINPFWVEEPTHPDDVAGHATIARAVEPIAVATGEHIPNRVTFKNLLLADGAQFIQADAVRLGGVSEFLTVTLMATLHDKPIVPHVGDMGQLHQHLVLFNHVALGNTAPFLEHIPHLRAEFIHPVVIEDGRYRVPSEPGSSCDLHVLQPEE